MRPLATVTRIPAAWYWNSSREDGEMKQQTGISLVELMVALLLGSIISVAATQLFLVNRQAESLQQGLSSVQDEGRFLLGFVARDLMQAGYSADGFALQPFVFDGDEGKKSVDLTGTTNDVIAFQVNDGFDCGGNPHYTGLKVYSVEDDGGLKCTYWTPTDTIANVIISGVEAFQVQYGIDTNQSGSVQLYTDANGAANALAGGGADAPRILAVRFAVVLSSAGRVGADAALAPANMQVLNETFASGVADNQIDLDDGHLHRLFSTTVLIRNQIDENS